MKKILFLSIFIIFIVAFFSVNRVLAATEVVLGDHVYGSDCYGGTDDFYVDIPSSYSGSKISLRASYDCADLGISLCSGWAASCQVNVSPGQRLNFQVSYYCGYCSPGENDSWTVYADSVTGPVCGNGSCESGETCSNCSSDCGACKKSDGSSCSSDSECSSNYCVHGTCRSSSIYCGDSYCDSGEGCSSCSSDCGSCGPTCGNHSCENGENYSNCSKDCYFYSHTIGGGCDIYQQCVGVDCVTVEECPQEEIVEKADGEYCDKDEKCKSANCQNYRCCLKGKTCCLSTNNCPSGYYCDENRHYCLPGKPDGQLCAKDELCKSGNCENGICCAWGQKCCQKHSNCGSKEYCDNSLSYCKYKHSIGQKCNGKEACSSGYCDSATWTCAELPAGTVETPATAPPSAETAVSPEAQAETNVAFVNLPPSVAIKKGEAYGVSVGIRNSGQKEIILAEAIQIDNQIPFVVDSGSKTTLRVPAKKIKLLPGEAVSNESKDILEAIESLNLVGKSAGSGEVKLRAVYFVDGSAQTIEAKIPTSVSYEHIDKELTASNLFNEQMVLVEKQTTIETVTSSGAAPGATAPKEVIFVEPEGDDLHKETANAWQKAQNQMNEAIQNLKDDFVGTVKPEILSFFETIEQLNEAETQQEITTATLRALAPPTMIAGFDLANLIDALDKKQQQEKYFLNHFGAKEFKTMPVYDEKGNYIGDSRAIIKEENGKIYAIKIGDL